jgi:predicted nucleic acid-binding protein
MARLVLDSGGLSALCGGSHQARERLRWISRHLGDVLIPTAVLVECVTGDGARDAEINRILHILVRDDAAFAGSDEPTARLAGALRYAARSDDGVDALVAAVAVGDGSAAVILTSDPHDLERLVARAPNVAVRRV